jgi:TnpA family transposase
LHPKQLMNIAINYLIVNKIVLPTYHLIADIITESYNKFERKLLSVLKNKLTQEHVNILDALLSNKDLSGKTPSINFIKNLIHSMQPKDIAESVEMFKSVKQYFIIFQPLIKELDLSQQAIEYYAIWFQKASKHQINQFTNKYKSHLYILAFIQHQYYYRNDMLLDVFLKSVQTSLNQADKKSKQLNNKFKNERRELVLKLTGNQKATDRLINDIADLVEKKSLPDNVKVKEIDTLIQTYKSNNTTIEEESLNELEEYIGGSNGQYLDCLAQGSNKLQRRVSSILNVLEFNPETSGSLLFKAIDFYKNKKGKITKSAPSNFLSSQEKSIVKDGKFNVSLYKSLLFSHISKDIKSGKLNSLHSYRYLSIDDYLIKKHVWEKEKDGILKSTSLSKHSDIEVVLHNLKERLNSQFDTVNKNYTNGDNKYLFLNKKDKFNVKTPDINSDESEYISKLLSGNNEQIPVFALLSEINDVVHFTKDFKHHSVKNNKLKIKEQSIFAGIIGKGCNIGIPKLASISKGVSPYNLKNTVNWYFSLKNIQEATNSIIKCIHNIPLPSIFCNDLGELHTSSDGRKVNVGVDSLLANYSFKYFGKNKGVSIYTFIDERQSLFSSTVISASEREAAYVIDGLLNNSVVKSSIHSTDTHGYTETIFGASYLIDTAFAPRIKRIGEQSLYSFTARSTYENKNYQVLPKRSINVKLIKEHWDDILRFMATVKTGHASASSLFKRLSSYARQHPLYQALKEFGRIIKSIFILRYYDDMKLRQRMEKQLNRIESSNKFSKAVLFSNNQELKEATKEEQEIVIACKVLIQNAIILWNYLYLSQVLLNHQDADDRKDIIKRISSGSVIAWSHVNLHGEYDFRKGASNDARFDLDKISRMQVN